MKAIIIGSGMAGLTAAAYLVRAGHQVTVYEQFSEIGGVTATLRQEGFGWDLGPLVLEGFGPGEPAGMCWPNWAVGRPRSVGASRIAVSPFPISRSGNRPSTPARIGGANGSSNSFPRKATGWIVTISSMIGSWI